MKKILAVLAFALMGAAFVQPVAAADKTDAEELVEEARFTIKKMYEHKNHGDKVRHYMKEAKAVFVVPELLKGAFLVGGEGGSGVLLAKGNNGQWSYPAFYNMGAGSFGFQFGAQASELMLIVRTGRGLSAILEDKVTLGGEISAAAGPVGEGMEASTTANIGADILAYSVNKGAFLGVSVEGAVIWPDKEENASFYNSTAATPEAIVLEGKHNNPKADKLRSYLSTLVQ